MTTGIDSLREWIGRSASAEAAIAAWPGDVLAATLDRDDPPLAAGDPLPPAWHWLYFPEVVKLADTGPDGHPRRGGFIPPVPLPRRMWAENRMRFHRPLRVGERVRKVSTVADVSAREGRSGPLVFVTLSHEIFGPSGLATEERHTTVYREVSASGAAPRPAPEGARWRRRIQPSPVLLFRFSALTMNSHRIHYDRDYATAHEGYPGLLVHGPLTAVLLLDLFRRHMPGARARSFSVRAVAPLYDTADFTVEGAPEPAAGKARLWAVDPAGNLAMSGEVEYGE